ncbi:MAG: hypothetical protein WC996_05830 [Peptostreptococcales bacterium]
MMSHNLNQQSTDSQKELNKVANFMNSMDGYIQVDLNSPEVIEEYLKMIYPTDSSRR